MSSALAVMNRQAHGSLLGGSPANLFSTTPYRPWRVPPEIGVRPGEALESRWDSNRAVREGLKASSVLATCIGKIAEKAASVPWYWWEVDGEGRVQRREIVEWLEYPRRDGKISRFEMMEEAHTHAILNGNGLLGIFWEGGERRIRPRELQAENPHGCAPVPDRVKHISAYQWDDSAIGGRRYWDADDIVHVIGRCDPSNRYWGWSVVEALAHTIDADVEARRLNLKRFRRSGYPGMMIIDEDVGDAKERRELEDDLNDRAERYFGAFMVLAGTQKVEKISTLTEVQLGVLKAIAAHRDEIAVALGFHPAIFSNEASTFNNMGNARAIEWQTAVLRNDRFSDALTNKLVRPRDRGRLWIAPYYGDVKELNDLEGQISDTARLVQECRVAVNDAIAVTGLPVPRQLGGDVPLVEANLIPATDAAEDLRSG